MSAGHWDYLRGETSEWGEYPRDYYDALSWRKDQ